jgi:hypothetical protein
MQNVSKWMLRAAALAVAFAAMASATAQTISATLSVASLPSTITLCRDAAANSAFHIDEQWQVDIDVDGDAATGDQTGVDAALVITTIQQPTPCSPTVVATADALQAVVAVWNPDTHQLQDSGATATLALDFAAHTMTISADLAGALAGVGASSLIHAIAVASYTADGNVPKLAADSTIVTPPYASIGDASGDVQQCTSPCSAAAPYYGLIDIVGLSTQGGGAGAFGANTLVFEYDLAGLPSSLDLCRNPALFASTGGFDSLWLAQIDVDNNPGTGYYGMDAAVFIVSAHQPAGCSTHSVAIGDALSAGLASIDAFGNLSAVADLPLAIDLAGSRLLVDADRTHPLLDGLSSASPIFYATNAYYDPNAGPAVDTGAAFKFGSAFTDAAQDVQACSGLCSPAQPWYAPTDLAGGSVRLADQIFASGFE